MKIIGDQLRASLRKETQDSLGKHFQFAGAMRFIEIASPKLLEGFQLIEKIICIKIQLHPAIQQLIKLSAKNIYIFVKVLKGKIKEIFIDLDILIK